METKKFSNSDAINDIANGRSKALQLLTKKEAKVMDNIKTIDISMAKQIGKKAHGALDYLKKQGYIVKGEIQLAIDNDQYYLLTKMFLLGRMDYYTYKKHKSDIANYNKSLGY